MKISGCFSTPFCSIWSNKQVFMRVGACLFFLITASTPSHGVVFDYDDGMIDLVDSLLKNNRIKTAGSQKTAVFGLVETSTKRPWKISPMIESSIIEHLIGRSNLVLLERGRINDVIKTELHKSTDWYFDDASVKQAGKLLGADIVITGEYLLLGRDRLRINIRAIDVLEGRSLSSSSVVVDTGSIKDLLHAAARESAVIELHQASREEDDHFVMSLVKAFAVIFLILLVLPFAMLGVAIDIVAYVVGGYEFPVVSYIYDLVWNKVAVQWYWGNTNELYGIITSCVAVLIVFAIASNSK